jgi:phosphatidylethanolamine/phosphatidyl-N-methylethanolamine N-methyltransferase
LQPVSLVELLERQETAMRTSPPEKPHPVLEWAEFFGSFLRQPARVGAIAPSSPELADAMLHECDLRNAKTVVEFGPGTGAFTRVILDRIGRRTNFLALELDRDHARRLRERFPGLNVHHDCAESIRTYLARHQLGKACYIISGLPWVAMPCAVQESILDATAASLAPGGMFTTFSYVHAFWWPSARRFRRQLGRRFSEIRFSPVVWRNLPPALVYRCRLPK